MKNRQINKNIIGILILSYNSINTIANTINSVKRYANQIVVVDSGSNDGTIELISRLGCEIYFRKWTDNFSEQRNFALKHFRTDWILMLDSDEYISKFDFNEFMGIANNQQIGGINVLIKNLIDNSKAEYYHRYTRIFRNNGNFKFIGSIHEQIRESIENDGFSIYDSDFEITHTGYSELNQNKIDRNIKLLENEFNNEPNNDFIKYHLASTYFAQGDNNKAEEYFMELISSDQLDEIQIDMVYIRLAQINLKYSNYDKVEKFTSRIPIDKNLMGLRNYILSSVKLYRNKFNEAYNLMVDEQTLNSSLIDKEFLSKSIETLRKMI